MLGLASAVTIPFSASKARIDITETLRLSRHGKRQIAGNPRNQVRTFDLSGPSVAADLIGKDQAQRIARDCSGAVAVAGMRDGDGQAMFKILSAKTGVKRDGKSLFGDSAPAQTLNRLGRAVPLRI